MTAGPTKSDHFIDFIQFSMSKYDRWAYKKWPFYRFYSIFNEQIWPLGLQKMTILLILWAKKCQNSSENVKNEACGVGLLFKGGLLGTILLDFQKKVRSLE